MDRASSSPPPALDAADLGLDRLARTFGVPDLPARLAAVDQRVASSLTAHDALLGPASLRMATAGGKRLRPLLTVVAASVGDAFDERVVAAAAAVELVQIGSLVHDDIIDGAPTRRGRPTINAAEGVDHAVLAGDYILARAAELAASVSREAAALIASTLGELCEGQVLELRDAFDPDRSVDAHLASIRGKTSALFECACRLGAHCAGLPPHNETALARFGAAFGMAFQLLDDVLDLLGDAGRLGKPTGSDIAAGVYTLPVITLLRGSDGHELRRRLPRSPRGDGHAQTTATAQALELVRRSGSIAEALATMTSYADEARRAVAHLNQTTVGEGLANFPRTYIGWALESFVDRRYLEVPLVGVAGEAPR
jgi:geranylgeranyl pyrophosphate synthase